MTELAHPWSMISRFRFGNGIYSRTLFTLYISFMTNKNGKIISARKKKKSTHPRIVGQPNFLGFVLWGGRDPIEVTQLDWILSSHMIICLSLHLLSSLSITFSCCRQFTTATDRLIPWTDIWDCSIKMESDVVNDCAVRLLNVEQSTRLLKFSKQIKYYLMLILVLFSTLDSVEQLINCRATEHPNYQGKRKRLLTVDWLDRACGWLEVHPIDLLLWSTVLVLINVLIN